MSLMKERNVMLSIQTRDTLNQLCIDKPCYTKIKDTLSFTSSAIVLNKELGIYVTTGWSFSKMIKINGEEADILLPVQLYDNTTKIEAIFENEEKKNLTLRGALRLSSISTALKRLTNPVEWIVGWLLEDGGIYKPRASPIASSSSFVFPSHSAPTECGPDVILFLTDDHFNSNYSINYSFFQSSSLFLDLLSKTFQDMIDHKELNLSVTKGEEIYLIGSPFGITSPTAFLNTISKGIVSNLIYDEVYKQKVIDDTIDFQVNEQRYILCLTDARHLPGVEGGGVFNSQKQLIGLSIPPIRKTSDAIAFNLFIPMMSIVEGVFQRKFEVVNKPPSIFSPDHTIEKMVKEYQQSLVFIRSGVYFGSGVIITPTGYVLTNAHLFPLRNSSPNPIVRVDNNGISRWHRAEIIHVSSSTLDVALLKIIPKSNSLDNNNNNINNNDNINININNFPYVNIEYSNLNDIEEGLQVLAIGHAIFPPSSRLTPSVSGGIISKTIRIEGRIYLIQTDVVIHKGNSGGMLIDHKGNFVGLVTFNSKSNISSISIPSLSFVIPCTFLFPFLHLALADHSSSSLQERERLRAACSKEMEENEEILRKVWKFQLDPLPSPPLPRLPQKYLQYISTLKNNSSEPSNSPLTISSKL